MTEMSVDGDDVVRLILQFCLDRGLMNSWEKLQEETGVQYNMVENLDGFIKSISHGKWDQVLRQTQMLHLQTDVLIDLFEYIVWDLVDLQEDDIALKLLRTSAPLREMRERDPSRFRRLDAVVTKKKTKEKEKPVLSSSERSKRRAALAESVRSHVMVVKSSQLLSLISDGMRWRRHTGQLPLDERKVDILGNKSKQSAQVRQKMTAADVFPKKLAAVTRFGEGCHAECVRFSPDGRYVASGSTDGFVEILDTDTAKLSASLEYQNEGRIMMHKCAVLAVCFSVDGQFLASGDKNGEVKVWRLESGKSVRRIERAHGNGVSSIEFARDSSRVLSAGFDYVIRIHGLKSGKMLKEFRGHTAYVNSACFSRDESLVLSAASDGSVKMWDVRGAECVANCRPNVGTSIFASVVIHPKNSDDSLVVSRGSVVLVVDRRGEVVRIISSDGNMNGQFLCGTYSRRGEYCYIGSSDGKVYCFDASTGEFNTILEAHDRDVHGITHHPHRNTCATISLDGSLKIWNE